MKFIRIGLTNNKINCLEPLLHDQLYVKGISGLSISSFLLNEDEIQKNNFRNPIFSNQVNDLCLIQTKTNNLHIHNTVTGKDLEFFKKTNSIQKGLFAVLTIKSPSNKLIIGNNKTPEQSKIYHGELIVIAEHDKVRALIIQPLEEYVRSVLHGEVPAKYHLEAIKAQAVCARTYALHPRVNHEQDFCNVCDSYLCCQCFSEIAERTNSIYDRAISETEGQILAYKDKPILALFSSCAGGHTENFEDCFSDWATNTFPPDPIPYLRGVSEAIVCRTNEQIIDESALKQLWHNNQPPTVDSWVKNFRWSIKLSALDLESHVHNNLAQLVKNKDVASHIVSPASGVFGEILAMSITKRGLGGTAIVLNIKTSKGDWKF